MTYFMTGNTAVENARALAQSALPNAPQQPEAVRRTRPSVAHRFGAVLRTVGTLQLRLADRVDPRPAI
ncbi:hypothetical protein AB0L70_12690 [Kribbella sp. NPDC051952]|uniref:hypothetical protein n=1 Tax=Kribbella sp. NPDC051952 TaxID=3154851 RepID=UPI003446FA1F